MQNIASIAAGNDDSVGEMIADALDKVGSNGVLSIESSNSIETFVEVTEGMEIDRGYISPQFVTNSERLLVEYDNCRVLVTDQKIESVRDIVPILEQVTRLNSPLLIIAEDVSGGAGAGGGSGLAEQQAWQDGNLAKYMPRLKEAAVYCALVSKHGGLACEGTSNLGSLG